MSYALLWVLALVLALASVTLLYLLAQLQARSGRAATAYGSNLIGRQMTIVSAKNAVSGTIPAADLYCNQMHVVLALSPTCRGCLKLIHDLKTAPRGDIAGIPLVVLCMGDFERCRTAVAELHSVPVLVQDVQDNETMDLWLAGFPTAFVIDEAGVVIDVRHPLSIEGVRAAVRDARGRGSSQTDHELERSKASALAG